MIKSKQIKNVLGGCILKKKMKVFSLCLALVMLVTGLTACNSDKVKKDDIVGQWYDSNGEMEIDVRADGSYDDGGYGTGTWKYLDDGVTIEFMDFYGSTKTTTIVKDEYGYSIYNGRYYRDEYPAEKLTNSNTNSNSGSVNSNGNNNLSNEIPTETQKITIDAFTGIKYEVTGISPYCKISINSSGCSKDAQERVTYTLDKEYYANGETAIITATIPSYKVKQGNNEYVLLNTQSTLLVAGQAEYVTSLSSSDIAFIETELADFIATRKAEDTSGQFLFGYNATFLSYINYVKSEDISYLSTLKGIKQEKFKELGIYNSYTCIYRLSYTTRNDDTHIIHIAITANNIIKDSNGAIKWGTKSSNDYDFTCASSDKGLEDCISMCVMNNSADYDISKVEI